MVAAADFAFFPPVLAGDLAGDGGALEGEGGGENASERMFGLVRTVGVVVCSCVRYRWKLCKI